MKLKVALIQMDIALARPHQNREQAAERIRRAAAGGARLILLPEMWSTGYCLPELAGGHADRDGEPSGAMLAALAQETGAFIAGSVADERQGKVYNHATLYGPSGAVLAAYDKAHLVPMMQEERWLAPGDRLVLGEIGLGGGASGAGGGGASGAGGGGASGAGGGGASGVGGGGVKAGLAICYDLRFPELFRSLTLAGAELFLIPAEWPSQRLHHWRTLIMARAIENQSYVLACNRVGSDGANSFPGHSMVVDPFGAVLAEGGEGEEIVTAEIDLAQVAEVRQRIPSLRDRRPELYR